MGASVAIDARPYSPADITSTHIITDSASAANVAVQNMSSNSSSPVPAANRKSGSSDSKWNRIEVRESVPTHLANLSELCSWRAMVRQLAFEKMYHHVSTKQTFTAKCQLFEEYEPNPFGAGQRLVIRCVLKYKIDNDA